MGRIRLRVREFAQEKGWNLTEVSKRTGIPYKNPLWEDRNLQYNSINRLNRIFFQPLR